MKKISLVLIALIISTTVSFAQFKDIPAETKTKLKSNNLIFGFINPKNFSMEHTVNVSFQSYGNSSVSLTSYTNTMSYKILDNMRVSADITMQYSPFASISGASPLVNKDFQNSFNGINLSRVSLEYKPLKNLYINVNYVNMKNNYWMDNYNNPWGYYGSGF